MSNSCDIHHLIPEILYSFLRTFIETEFVLQMLVLSHEKYVKVSLCILTSTRPYPSLSSLLFWRVTNAYHFSFLNLHFWNVSGVEHFFIYLAIFSFLMVLPTNDTHFFIRIFILLIYKNFLYI